MDRVKNVQFWMHLFVVLACAGMPLMLLGKLLGSKPLTYAGVLLGAPLLAGAAVIVVLFLPYGVWVRLQETRREDDAPPPPE